MGQIPIRLSTEHVYILGEESFDPDEFHAVYIYPNAYVAMSFEGREALIGKMKEPNGRLTPKN